MHKTTRPVRVRIAPSPTGNCHVGTARNALYNLLFARQHGGRFILRIDDTDRERSTAASERGILEGLRWLGLDWDEGPDVGGPYGPYRQSERLPFYREHASRLVALGRAYPCFCTPAELKADRARALANGEPPRYSGRCRHLPTGEVAARRDAGTPHVLRLRIEPKPMALHDLIQGPVAQDAALLGDPVIVKSDGMPTYHFATVVDEHAMRISHVIRGVEHLTNTFLQLQIFEALGFEPPAFAHLGLLLNPDRSKISKRDGAVYVGDFRELGYLPEALVNGLALSGWSPETGEEILSFDDLLRLFRLERCSASNAIFDREKLLWLNGVYIRSLRLNELVSRVAPFMAEAGLATASELMPEEKHRLAHLVSLEQTRLKTLAKAPALLSYFYEDPHPGACVDLLVRNRHTRRRARSELRDGLAAALHVLNALDDGGWTAACLAEVLNRLVTTLGWKRGELFMAIRIAVSGRAATPGLFETLQGVGRAPTLRRLHLVAAELDS